MKRLLIAAAAAVVAVVALAACGGGGGSNSSAMSSNGTTTVSVEKIGDSGSVLVDSAGKALYASDQEAANSGVVCTDMCTSFWMPLTIGSGAPTGDGVAGKLGVFKRPDGTRQVTFDGKRLYTFAQDSPGEVTGDGFSDAFGGQQFTWHVVKVGGTSSPSQGGSTSNPYSY
jgi:predicted lipoprotein with Yx(FWY)xxD motif